MSKFSNILRMIILLKSRGKMKSKELATELEVDERMVRKYREDMEMAGVHINSYAGVNGGYSLEGYDYLLDLKLSKDENSALMVANEQLKTTDFIYYKEFKQIVDKINSVKKKDFAELNEVEYLFKGVKSFEAKDERKKCLDINAAIISKNKIKIKYFSLSSGESERIVQPYAIINYNGAIYFTGFCENRNKVIDFKISRIKEYSILDSKYEIPKEFSVKDYMKNSLGIYRGETFLIKLKIEKPMSYIISEKIWSENQIISWRPDESIIFEAEFSGKTEIVSWILSMGSTVKVLEPESLKIEIKNTLNEMIIKI